MRRFVPAFVLLTTLLALRAAAADNAVAPNPRVLWEQRQPPHYMAGSRGFMFSVPGVDELVWTGATGDVLLASTTIAEASANGFQDGLFASHDVGRTWTRQGERIAGRSVHVFAAHPVTPTALLAGLSYTVTVSGTVDAGGMYQSVDSGVTWQSVLPDLQIQTIAHSLVDPQTVYAAATQPNPTWPAAPGVYKSGDGGATWVPISDRLFHGIAPHPSLPLVVFAAYRGTDNDSGAPGLYRSDDGGITWTQLLADRVDTVVVDPRQPQRMFVLGLPYEKAWRTDDGGATWADLDDALGRHVVAVMPDLTSAVSFGQDCKVVCVRRTQLRRRVRAGVRYYDLAKRIKSL